VAPEKCAAAIFNKLQARLLQYFIAIMLINLGGSKPKRCRPGNIREPWEPFFYVEKIAEV
jgi:hypothetical protein